MRKSLLLIFSVVLSLLLVACNSDSSSDIDVNELKEKVHEYSIGNFENINASITSDELIVTENGKDTTYNLPDDEFFVSIAPYVSYTHP